MTLPGVAYIDDLAVQAFARHLETAMDPGVPGRSIVAGMRAFLEDKPHLAPAPPWRRPPATGYRAVELLATAAGLSSAQIEHGRRASRIELAGSAWILDPADGLPELLDLMTDRADVVLVADADDPATGPVLEALDLAGRFPVIRPAEPVPMGPDRPTLLIDDDWSPILAAAFARGTGTALVDRFGAGSGTPELRATDLPGLLPGVADWLDRHARTEGER